MSAVFDMWHSLERSTRLWLLVALISLGVCGFGVFRMFHVEPATALDTDELSVAEDMYHEVEWNDKNSHDPEIAVSYVTIDEDSLNIYFAQRFCDEVSIRASAVDDKGVAFKSATKTYHRGDALSSLVVEIPMRDMTFTYVNEVQLEVEGAVLDESRLRDMLDDAKRSRALVVEGERLLAADEARADANAEREAEAAREAEREAQRRAEEAERKRKEEEAKKSETAHRDITEVVALPAGWEWGDTYYSDVVGYATAYGSETSQFLVNDLKNLRVVMLGWNGSQWDVTAWYTANHNGYRDGFTTAGLFRVVAKSPDDGSGAYHANGEGHDDWFVAISESFVSEDIVEGGYHLRYFDGRGYWRAVGFAHGYDEVATGVYTADGMTYLDLLDAYDLWLRLDVGTTVYNFV